jgi:hypothetical protein
MEPWCDRIATPRLHRVRKNLALGQTTRKFQFAPRPLFAFGKGTAFTRSGKLGMCAEINY